MMMQQHLTFPAGNETIAALIYKQDETDLPTTLFLHGASTAMKDRIKYFADYFVEKGMPLIAIDFSGHGESTGKLHESSLQKRINEAHAAIEYMDPDKKLTIMGSSMGGHIALEMLKTWRVETLVLFCPAVYSDESVPLQFDSGFTEAIRKENSRENSALFDELQKFMGRLFIIIGDLDGVIPHGVLTKLVASATKAKQKELIFVPGASHAIHSWLETHPEDFARVREKIFAHID